MSLSSLSYESATRPKYERDSFRCMRRNGLQGQREILHHRDIFWCFRCFGCVLPAFFVPKTLSKKPLTKRAAKKKTEIYSGAPQTLTSRLRFKPCKKRYTFVLSLFSLSLSLSLSLSVLEVRFVRINRNAHSLFRSR